MLSPKKQERGFTLLELLVVIAIVAILSVVVILTLNPAELLRQARDSNRISDLASLKSALALYLADVSSTSINIGSNVNCYVSIPSGTAIPAGFNDLGTSCGGRFIAGATIIQVVPIRNSDGTGWIPANFGLISSGSPLPNLPVDPTNNVSAASSTSYFYAYRPGPASCTTSGCTQYEITAHMESTKYQKGGSGDVESTDGGRAPGYYEAGTAPGLAL